MTNLCNSDCHLIKSFDHYIIYERVTRFSSNPSRRASKNSKRFLKFRCDENNKEERIVDLELHNKNRYSAKLKSHSVRVRTITECVHQCQDVFAAIVGEDYKDILNSYNHDFYKFTSAKLFAAMCLHHLSCLSYTEKLNIYTLLYNLTEYIVRNITNPIDDFIDLFFRNLGPKRCFNLISRIWYFYVDIENSLKYSLCKKIMESKSLRNEQFLCANIKNLVYLWKIDYTNRKDLSLLLSLLHYAVTSNQIEDVKFVRSIIATNMDCQELVEALKIYIVNSKMEKLLSLSMLIDTVDDILMTKPRKKLLLMLSYVGKLLALEQYEEFKAAIIRHRRFFLSDNCKRARTLTSSIGTELQHARFTLLMYLLYFCITTNQNENKSRALSEILNAEKYFTDDMTGSINLFFSLLTNVFDRNNRDSIKFTEVLLHIWEKKMELKLAVIHAYSAYLRKSKCLELHGNFVQYHFQCLKSSSFLGLTENATSAKWENFWFIIHHISNLSEMPCFNLTIPQQLFHCSFRQYVSHCDESQILFVSDTIEKLGIIWKSDQMPIVDAILMYGKELVKRKCFERYKSLVIRYQYLLISNCALKKIVIGMASDKISFLTFLNLLMHYTISKQYTIVMKLRSVSEFYSYRGMDDTIIDYISECDEEQFISTSLSLQYIWQWSRDPLSKLDCFVIFWKKIRESGYNCQYRRFIVDHKHFILKMKKLAMDGSFLYKTEYFILLSHLFHEFKISNKERDMGLTLRAIKQLKHDMLNDFRGTPNVKHNDINEEERTVFGIFWEFNIYKIDDVLNDKKTLTEYINQVIFSWNTSSRRFKASVFKIFTYYLLNIDTVQQERGIIEIIASLSNVYEEGTNLSDKYSDISSVIFDVIYSFLVLKHEIDQAELATTLLHLNQTSNSDLVKEITVAAGKILNWKTLAHQSFTSDKNMIIYKSFCIVRHKKKTHRLEEINLEEYTSYFNFIEMIDQEEKRQRIIRQTILLLVLLLLLTSITSDGHHKSEKLKKYLSLKYAYDDLVLYLLWCSGDVETNPGPTFSKIRLVHASEKERKWTCEVCSVLIKLIKELPQTSKPKCLWKEKPVDWPPNEPYFDPYNKSKVQNDNLLSVERLLKCLIKYCDVKKICIPEAYRYEINLFFNNNKPLLFETYIFRKEKHNICEALSNLLMFKDRGEKINQDMRNCGITLNFDLTQTSQNYKKIKRKGETVTNTRRDLAVLLCKLIKGLPINEKCDGLWKMLPPKWPKDEPFYSPHNEKKRQGICPDNELVDNLIKYCKSNSVVIPPQYQDMVNAWTESNMDELIKIHTIYANVAKLEHSLKYLQVEVILAKPDSLDFLKRQGLTLDTDTWKLKDGQKDGKQSNKMVENPSEELAIKKSSSYNKRDTKFQKLNISQQTAELYENTLLQSTDDSKTVDAESFTPESSSKRKKQPKLGGSNKRISQKKRLDTETSDQEEYEETKKQKMNKCLYETSVSLTQKEEDELNNQLDEPVPPLSEKFKECCPEEFDNILNDLLNSNHTEDLESFINFDEY